MKTHRFKKHSARHGQSMDKLRKLLDKKQGHQRELKKARHAFALVIGLKGKRARKYLT